MSSTRTVELSTLLNAEQLAAVEGIINEIKRQQAGTEMLREYLHTLNAELGARGVDPDYLHYAILYATGIY